MKLIAILLQLMLVVCIFGAVVIGSALADHTIAKNKEEYKKRFK